MSNPRNVGYAAYAVHRTGPWHGVSHRIGDSAVIRNVNELLDEESWSRFPVKKTGIAKVNERLWDMTLALRTNAEEHR